jgi:hypothetical protein
MNYTEEALKTMALIKPLLAGKDPRVQGAVLTELLSIWLAGHVVKGDLEQTRQLRAELLVNHCELVCELVKELVKEEERGVE